MGHMGRGRVGNGFPNGNILRYINQCTATIREELH